MTDQANRLSYRFLELLNDSNGKELFEILDELMNVLETKNDPDMTEICLVENLTQFIEKFQIMTHNLKSYSKGKHTLLGEKLDKLYESNSSSNLLSELY